MPWWVGWVGAGLVVTAIFWAGDNYGWNAHQYAKCKTETARRNAAVARVNADELKRQIIEAAKRIEARNAFNAVSPSIGQCLLTGDQAAALNGIGE